MSDLVERLRQIEQNAAGEAFLPPGWQELANLLPDIIAALDAQPVGLNVERLADEIVEYYKTFSYEDVWTKKGALALARWLNVRAALASGSGE